MRIQLRGEKIEITEAINSYVEEKISKLDKFFKEKDIQAKVTIKMNGKKHAIDVTIPYDKFIIRSEEIHDDLYAAIDLVLDKLERQIRKNKTKMKKHTAFNINYAEIEDEVNEEENKVVKRKTIEMKPMSEEEAILELELLSHDFFIYKDSDTESVNVVYKRKDGNYGIIETN